MLNLALLLALFVLAGVGVWCVLASEVFPDAKRDLLLLWVGLALAPPLVAWHCALTLRVIEGEAPIYYVLAVTLLSALPLALLTHAQLRQRLKNLPSILWASIASSRWVPWILGLFVLEAIVLVCFMTWLTPLRENDALEYATVARLIFERRSISFYPVVDSRAAGSFYGPWTHPVGYPALLGLSNFIQGHASVPGLMRAPAVYSAFSLAMLIWCIGGRSVGGFAAIVALSTPLFFVSSINTFVDPVRVAASFAALTLVATVLIRARPPRWTDGLWLGLALGLAFFCHSIGIVVILIACGLLMVLCRRTIAVSAVIATVMCSSALLVVAPDLSANLSRIGAIVADVSPVSSLPEVRALEHLRLSRSLDTPYQLLRNGLFRGFTDPISFGVTFWLASAGFAMAALLAYRLLRPGVWTFRDRFFRIGEAEQLQIIWMVVVATWMAMALCSTAVGIFEFVKNPRYVLTLLPALALLAGWAIVTVGEPNAYSRTSTP